MILVFSTHRFDLGPTTKVGTPKTRFSQFLFDLENSRPAKIGLFQIVLYLYFACLAASSLRTTLEALREALRGFIEVSLIMECFVDRLVDE